MADNSTFITDRLSQTEPISIGDRLTRASNIRVLFACHDISFNQIGKVTSIVVSPVNDIARDQVSVQTSLNNLSHPSGDSSH